MKEETKMVQLISNQEVIRIVTSVRTIASRADLNYVVCMWKSPFNEISYRSGYFTDIFEAIRFAKSLEETYRDKWKFPYFISSSVDSVNNIGNLFD